MPVGIILIPMLAVTPQHYIVAQPIPVVRVVSPSPAPVNYLIDDYPWKNVTDGTDSWGYTTRQCVSFAAFRLAQQGRAVGMWGSALNWDNYGKITTPRVGTIAHWNADESSTYYAPNGGIGRMTAGSYGHVAYVTKVYNDGSVLVEQYNLDKDRAYSTMRLTAPRYLSF